MVETSGNETSSYGAAMEEGEMAFVDKNMDGAVVYTGKVPVEGETVFVSYKKTLKESE